MQTALVLVTAFFVGLSHALGPDHLAAVSALINKYPERRLAIRFCLRWGLGHMIPVCLWGVIAAHLSLHLPVEWIVYAERAVGLVLLVLGVWVLQDMARGHLHVHVHEHGGVRHLHLHSHAAGPSHRHEHSAMLVGVLHGLAGAAPILLLVPVAFGSSTLLLGAYLVAFSLGMIVTMVVYGVSASALMRHAARRGLWWRRSTQFTTGVASVGLGLFWLSS